MGSRRRLLDLSRFLVGLGLASIMLAACESRDDLVSPPLPPDGTPEEVTAQAATLVTLVSSLGVGAPNLVGALPCVLRGYILLEIDEDSRDLQVNVVGCELISGVRIDGTGVLANGFPVTSTQDLAALDFTGSLVVATLTWERRVAAIRIGSVTSVRGAGVRPRLSDILTAEATVDGTLWTVDDPLLFDRPERTDDRTSRSLGSVSLGSLEDRDAERIVLDLGGQLAGFFLNELLETTRGEHSHDDACGSVRVVPVQAVNTTLNFEWSECAIGGGLFVSGTFALTGVPPFTRQFAWTISGSTRIGGAVPEVVLDGFDWTLTFAGDPAESRRAVITAVLREGSTERVVNVTAFWST